MHPTDGECIEVQGVFETTGSNEDIVIVRRVVALTHNLCGSKTEVGFQLSFTLPRDGRSVESNVRTSGEVRV